MGLKRGGRKGVELKRRGRMGVGVGVGVRVMEGGGGSWVVDVVG